MHCPYLVRLHTHCDLSRNWTPTQSVCTTIDLACISAHHVTNKRFVRIPFNKNNLCLQQTKKSKGYQSIDFLHSSRSIKLSTVSAHLSMNGRSACTLVLHQQRNYIRALNWLFKPPLCITNLWHHVKSRVTDSYHFDEDPDPAFNFNADPDPYQSDANLRQLVYRPSRAPFEPPQCASTALHSSILSL